LAALAGLVRAEAADFRPANWILSALSWHGVRAALHLSHGVRGINEAGVFAAVWNLDLLTLAMLCPQPLDLS
jgi:hypothetical protein